MGEREGAILSQQILEFLHSSICLKPYLICGGWMVVVGGWCLFPILVFSFSKSWTIEDIILQLETFVVFCLIWNNLPRPNPQSATEANSDLGLTFNFFSFQIIQCHPVLIIQLGLPSFSEIFIYNDFLFGAVRWYCKWKEKSGQGWILLGKLTIQTRLHVFFFSPGYQELWRHDGAEQRRWLMIKMVVVMDRVKCV